MPRRYAKRRRTMKAKRPVDKLVISDTNLAVVANSAARNIFTATYPCTVSGFRAAVTFRNHVITRGAVLPITEMSMSCCCHWALVIVRQGMTSPVMSVGGLGPLYTPEQNLLMYGQGSLDWSWHVDTLTPLTTRNNGPGPVCHSIIIESGTKRKMMGGDTLQLIQTTSGGLNATTVDIDSTVQFFCLS